MILLFDFSSMPTLQRGTDSHYAHLLLSYGLKKYFGIEKYELFYGENKKPYLKNENLFFNLSHSKNIAVCAFSESEIGCDVEFKGEYKSKIAKRFFTEKEFNALEKSKNQNEDFTKIWTLKESVLKKSGKGITEGLDAFDFSGNLKENSFEKYGSYFTVFPFDEYIVSVCGEREETEIIKIKKEEIEI